MKKDDHAKIELSRRSFLKTTGAAAAVAAMTAGGIGIRWQIIQVRWVALALFVITALKVFIKDLWTLGQLYRVFSFVGLAITLMLVSFLYQRYLGGKKSTEDKE
jgi:uncharacterized membrane protein